jgi:hypothetical protein
VHPQLLSSLATERGRDMAATANARRSPAAPSAQSAQSARAGRRAPRMTLPRFRVSWTRTTLAAVADRRRGRSWVIVISATRTL